MEDIDKLTRKGIEDGRRAFKGPKIIQIDLTGRCNNNCIGCWVHSPYIKDPPHDKNVMLPFNKVKDLIKDLYYLGAEEIFISGAGEPFLHPNILEIIELIKRKELKLNIITNFTLIDEKKAKSLVDLGVDMVTASIWAALPETYRKTHPGKTEEDFYKIKDRLKKLSQIKMKENKYLPHIKIYNVICNLNYKEIQEMIDFGLETQVEFIEFQIMDIIEGETSFFALSDKQVKYIKEQFNALSKRRDLYFKDLKLFNLKSLKEKELKEFPGRFINTPQGFSLSEKIKEQENQSDRPEVLRSMTCPRDVHTKPSFINPICDEENNIFTFTFPYEECKKYCCPDCLVDKEGQLKIRFLSILGFASFLRRLNSANIYEQIYEKEIIDNLPCYIGWTYSRILSTGEVIPCCKATLKPLGNIFNNIFLDIWNSYAYQEFRYKAKSLSKSNPYFKQINCYKSCDNVGMNLQLKQAVLFNNKLNSLDSVKKVKPRRQTLPIASSTLVIPAGKFKKGNLNVQCHKFGKGIVIDGGWGFGFAEYEINFKESGNYELWSYYATEEKRPVELYFDDNLITKEALGYITSGWTTADLIWFKETLLDIKKGKHILKIYTEGFIPHVYSFAFLKEVKDNQNKTNKHLSEYIYQEPSTLKLLRNEFKTTGFISSTFKLLNYVRSGRLFNNYLDFLGILNGKYAFKGPFHVQIDLTNNCNNNCIGCWSNSPLLEEKALSLAAKKQTLPYQLVKRLITELSEMGTKEIYFSGGGEPFMHPQIMEILKYAKERGLTCYVNTNFTLLDRERIIRLIESGVEHLTVSTWAATAKTYAITHPNKYEETFRQIIENLKFLNKTKKKTPYIKLYNVIFNLNYQELKEMLMLAKETACESVEFTLIDTIPGKTDRLLLNPQQIKELQAEAQEIASSLDKNGYFGGVLAFRFGAFLRRIASSSDLAKATYDRNIIDKMPCYIGWCFSRIMPNGDVNACLKAHRIPTGNLYQASFRQIWNGKKQIYFRSKTLVKEKTDSFFRLIGNDPGIKEAGCYKSCDDIGRNIDIHNRIMSLSSLERRLLRIAVKMKKKPELNSRINTEDLIAKGILNGRKAFTGPEHVVIDITNRCNEKCIGCWLYSPLLKQKPETNWLKEEIEFSKLKDLIKTFADLGTQRIRFTGGGEPFMYPKIMELIEYTKSRGLICCITTNFSLLDEEKIKELIKLRVDELAVSLWASNAETYRKTHPGSVSGLFEKIKENLMILTKEKKDKPFVTLSNVICNLNYLELEDMFKFALDVNADGIYFTLIDILEGTGSLLLDRDQRRVVLQQIEAIRERRYSLPRAEKIALDYFEGFVSRLKEEGALVGDYDRQRVSQIPCYAGWFFTRILADGSVVPCCRGVKKIMGNINKQDFKNIWFSHRYDKFRIKTQFFPRTDSYFSEIGCLKICDNLMHNEEIQRRIEKLNS